MLYQLVLFLRFLQASKLLENVAFVLMKGGSTRLQVDGLIVSVQSFLVTVQVGQDVALAVVRGGKVGIEHESIFV